MTQAQGVWSVTSNDVGVEADKNSSAITGLSVEKYKTVVEAPVVNEPIPPVAGSMPKADRTRGFQEPSKAGGVFSMTLVGVIESASGCGGDKT